MDPERARELLAAERERIERELAEVQTDSGGDPDEVLDEGDQATYLDQAERDQSREDTLREQLAALERAEQRLADGTYGLSVESGEPIPDARLEAVPTAELTVEEERARGG